MEKHDQTEVTPRELKEHIALDKKHLKHDKMVLWIVGALLLLGVGAGVVYYKEFRPKSGPQIVEESRDAVVRIGVLFKGLISLPQIIYDTQSKQLVAGPRSYRPVRTTYTGTGFRVGSEGYIVTNAHVVDVSAETRREFIYQQFAFDEYELVKGKIPDADTNTQLLITKEILAFYHQNAAPDDDIISAQVSVFRPAQKTGTIEDYINGGVQIFPEDVQRAEGVDIAILKTHPSLFPSHLKLGNSNKITQGSRVFVLGYPGIADLSDEGNVELSSTAGVVSAIRKSPAGDYNVIQVDAPIAGGNSGGPALDEQGRVIGVVTFGANATTESYNFLLPINLVKEFLDLLKVKYSGIFDGIVSSMAVFNHLLARLY